MLDQDDTLEMRVSDDQFDTFMRGIRYLGMSGVDVTSIRLKAKADVDAVKAAIRRRERIELADGLHLQLEGIDVMREEIASSMPTS